MAARRPLVQNLGGIAELAAGDSLKLPVVAALPSGVKGDACVLTGDGFLYVHDGTEWRKGTHLGQTTYQGLRGSASGSLCVPPSLLNDAGGGDVEIGGVADYQATRLPFGVYDRIAGPLALQGSLSGINVAGVLPGNGNVIVTVGLAGTKTGTWTTTAPAVTSVRTRALRQAMPTSTTAGNASGVYYARKPLLVANGAGRGGFWFRALFGFNTFPAASRFFVGLQAGTTLPSGATDPGTLTNVIGFGSNAAHSTIYRIASGASAGTPVDTTWTRDTTDLFQVTICSPREEADTVYVHLLRLSDLAEYSETLTTSIPANTTYLGPVVQVSNGTNASAVSIDLARMWCEWPNLG